MLEKYNKLMGEKSKRCWKQSSSLQRHQRGSIQLKLKNNNRTLFVANASLQKDVQI